MTIKEFSQLCNCTAQTLRYYDSIDLLRPARVDRFTGYRYYDSEQALDYVKIKNLQSAMFSIEEIRELLKEDNDAIVKAMDRKIAEQKAKLEAIIQIQKSYRNEYMNMLEIIKNTKDKIAESVGTYDPAKEYGISEEYYRAIIEDVNTYFDQAMADYKDKEFPDFDEKNNKIKLTEQNGEVPNPLQDPNYHVVFEENGWKYTAEILEKLPILDREYTLYFELDDEKYAYNDFCSVVMKIVRNRNSEGDYKLTCTRNKSKDGKNHFWLLRK